MKLTEKISWLMGRVQRSLFPHLNECLPTPLTEQEKQLVSILEIVEIERHVPRIVTRYRYPGRKPLDRQSLARAFVAKALYRYPTTSDLHRALQSEATCAGYADSALQVPCHLRPLFLEPLLPLPLAGWAMWCMIRWWQNICHMNLSATSAGIPRRLLAVRSQRRRLTKNRSHAANGDVPPRASNGRRRR